MKIPLPVNRLMTRPRTVTLDASMLRPSAETPADVPPSSIKGGPVYMVTPWDQPSIVTGSVNDGSGAPERLIVWELPAAPIANVIVSSTPM
jgi:hypothetical protein